MFNIPKQAKTALSFLNDNGHKAYLVGGCVRDLIMNNTLKDIDITTSATPQQVQAVFKDFKVIETGLKHGTVTVIIDDEPIEITTFREDSNYSDFRHPDKITFSSDLETDLKRRDFTMNAFALSINGDIINCHDGINDINQKIIRCVGEPDKRFNEDGLRILRALRFASVLGFSIEEATALSIHKNKKLLEHISAERIQAELTKLLCGKNCAYILEEFSDVLSVPIPEIQPLIGFKQHTKYHCYDVWRHTIAVIKNIDPTPILRLSALMHDFGKPSCFTLDENKVGHFYGHAEKSYQIAQNILKRLKFDNVSINQILLIIKNHMIPLTDTPKAVKRLLKQFGVQNLNLILKHKKADCLGQGYEVKNRLKTYASIQKTIEKILKEEQCFSLKDMKINGDDLIKLGYSGKEIGKTLDTLLNAIINNKVTNDRTVLLSHLKPKSKPYS